MIGFHKPTFPSRDDAIFTVIANILTQGRSSILYSDLVKDKQLVASVNALSSMPGSRFPNLFTLMASPRYPHTNEEVEQAVLAHLERLKTVPVSDSALQKVKNALEGSEIRVMRSNMGLARTLTRYQLLYGDWKYYLKLKDMVNGVTAQDIMTCAKQYLSPENRTTAYLVKKSK
jgi:predicted Zn-dependent peptidase